MKFAGFTKFGSTRVLAGLALLLIIIGLAILARALSGSSQGSISAPPVQKQTTPKITQVQVNGRFVSFKYPSDFSPSPTDKPAGSELETFAFIKRPSPFWFLNVSVNSLPSGNLADDGSYNSRLSQPGRYSQSILPINGQAVTVFSDATSGYSKTAFLAHGDKDVSIALSASLAEQDLDDILKSVLQSLTWR